MKNKFTQGEWCVVKDSTYPTLHQIWNKTFQGNIPTYIARTCYAPRSEANAKLIAAAPDLLEATIGLVNSLPIGFNNEYVQYAKAAIKKATE